jgi:nitroimidazol reductase NimA-like FMN-containing flavoprotein (pyridoxamine 5'-phosphate oxidase superfamily)
MDHPMTDTVHPRQQLRDLFAAQSLAVLSTHGDGQPYASLVAFVASDDLKAICFATDRSTRKFANLTAIPRAALLIDSRANRPEDFHEAVAVTATGVAEEVPAAEREPLQARYLEKHPQLADFVTDPGCALVRINVDGYYLVSRFQNVVEIPMSG